jgi:hypothetical protein
MRFLRLLAWMTGLALAMALLAPTAALATETETVHVSGTGTEPLINPCSGASGTLTFEFEGVVHTTTLDSGTFHAAATNTGTWTFVPDDPSQPGYAGEFASFSEQNFTSKNFTLTDTFYVVLHGSDGSLLRLRAFFHVTTNANGTVTAFIEVNEVTCL